MIKMHSYDGATWVVLILLACGLLTHTQVRALHGVSGSSPISLSKHGVQWFSSPLAI